MSGSELMRKFLDELLVFRKALEAVGGVLAQTEIDGAETYGSCSARFRAYGGGLGVDGVC